MDKTGEEVIRILHSSKEVLNEKEAERRLKIYGLNNTLKRMGHPGIKFIYISVQRPLLILLFIAL